MIACRRRTVLLGAGAAALTCGVRLSWAADPVEIGMAARADGAHVYFDPVGIHVEPGATLRWTNLDARNSHTATVYHPANLDRPRRIPPSAAPWDSGYLLPGESFSVTLAVPGVYDYFCVPHEAAGMVGRIVVGDAVPDPTYPSGEDGLPAAALEALPSADAILRQGAVGARGHKEEGG